MTFRLAALLLCTAVLFAAPARAEDDIYVPTSAWLVGQALMTKPEGMEDIAMPCVMVNQYSNGYTLRLSGGGGKILAMAVDFRQEVFESGDSYNLKLSVDPDFEVETKGEAYDEATLIVNLQKNPEFKDAVVKGKIMTLDIQRKSMDFAMVGVREGITRMEQCYNEAAGKTAAPAVAQAPQEQQETPEPVSGMQSAAFSKDAPRPPEENKEEQGAMIENVAAALSTLEPAAGGGDALPEVPQQPVKQKSFAAKAPPQGQALAQSWMPQAQKVGDIIYTPPAEQSASQMPQRPVQSPGVYNNAVHHPPQSPYMAAPPAPPAQVGQNVQRQWRAIKGMNLREVLDIWTRDVQARMIWQADEEFAIEESISLEGSLETAVMAVLQSYDGNKRPVGRLYTDPATAQKVLLIETKSEFW